jgi:CheY-like chemotaxis protein
MSAPREQRPILIADDEGEMRAILREHLTAQGHEVLEAADGLETLWAITHKRPGVVLLDLSMPRLGGLELLPRIRDFDTTIRVIVVTAHTTDENVQRLAAFGVPVLHKPVDLTRLDELLAAGGDVLPRSTSAILHTSASKVTPAPGEAAARSGPLEAVRARVLLVDGNPASQTIGASLFKRLGCRVDVVADGEEAIALLMLAPYDVVFIDCATREADGYRATAEIRRRQRETVWRVPIVGLSPRAGAQERARAIRAGMDDCIGTPLRRADADAILSRWGEGGARRGGGGRGDDDAGEPTALDPARVAGLAELTGGDDAALEDLFATFLSDAGRCVASMRQAVEAGDPAGLRRAAHTLKGGSSAIGASVLAILCSELETIAAKAATGATEQHVGRIEREVDRVRLDMQRHRGRT